MNRRSLACRSVITVALLTTALASGCSSGSPSGGATTSVSTSVATRDGAAPSTKSSFDRIPDIVADVAPSVVVIQTDVGEGSGVIWDAEGHIVTNNHVISGAQSISVSFADGTSSAAELVATDPITDLAVVQVAREGLPPAEFADSLPRVGELAIAMGNPLGFDNTVSAGIVSSLHRNIPGSAPQSQALVDLIQTDAAISPGNSGGALVNDRGQVIGINVAYIPPQARAVSIGFAIPSPTVIDVVTQLLETGEVSHAFFGVVPTTLTPQIRDSLGVHATSGAVVTKVVSGGPAAAAGIEPGDVITAVGATGVATVEEFLAVLRGHEPGDVVEVSLTRGDNQMITKVTLADRPPID